MRNGTATLDYGEATETEPGLFALRLRGFGQLGTLAMKKDQQAKEITLMRV